MSGTIDNFRLFIDGHFPEPAINPSGAVVMGLGTSTAPAKTSAVNKNFIQFYLQNDGSGDSVRGIYNRLYLGAADGGGESLRSFTTVKNVVASTAHGAHISLNFDATGKVSGLGVASRSTLHIPNDGTMAGTMAAIQAEIWSDGSLSDPVGATELSFIRVVAGGDADGIADVEDDAFLFSLQGFTANSGNMVRTAAPAGLAASVRVKVGETTYYLPLYTDPSS